MPLISLIKAIDSGVKSSSNKPIFDFISVLFPVIFNYSSFLSSIFLNLFKSSSYLSSSSNPLLKNLPNGEYSKLACPTVLGL